MFESIFHVEDKLSANTNRPSTRQNIKPAVGRHPAAYLDDSWVIQLLLMFLLQCSWWDQWWRV